jgi:hypothetical protein
MHTVDANQSTAHYRSYQMSRISLIRSELKNLENERGALWNALQNEDPYQKDSLPVRELLYFTCLLLRSEYQLWTTIFHITEESMAIFVSICDSAIAELQRVLSPVLSNVFAAVKGKISGSSLVIKQTKLCLVRLDVFDALNQHYDQLR